MRLASKEFWHVTITADHDLAGVPVEVSTDRGVSWHPTERTGAGARFLVGPGTGMAEVAGTYLVYVRVTDNPEVVVLLAGTRVVEAL